jgi:hypothetical protein
MIYRQMIIQTKLPGAYSHQKPWNLGVQSAHGLVLSVGFVIGMMVALLKQMHLQNDTGLYAIYVDVRMRRKRGERGSIRRKGGKEGARERRCSMAVVVVGSYSS